MTRLLVLDVYAVRATCNSTFGLVNCHRTEIPRLCVNCESPVGEKMATDIFTHNCKNVQKS